MKRQLFTSLIIISGLLLAFSPVNRNTEKIWERGKKAENAGQYEKALSIWESARSIAAKNEEVIIDPRIGFDYIELVTRREMKDFYMKASDMYYWALSECTQEKKSYIRNEVERIRPIAPAETYKRWRSLLDRDVSKLCTQLKGFWDRRDLTVSSEYNERLLEHWERIAYARTNFRRASDTVYGTDDRGLIYVRFGEPDRTNRGNIQFYQGKVRGWVTDAMEERIGTNQGISTRRDIENSGGSILQGMKESLLIKNYAKEARLHHKYPSYVIWIYDRLTNSEDENTIFIFGDNGDTGEFGLRKSMEDMIPSTAFVSKQIVSPGYLLQLMFYEEVRSLAPYFSDAFEDLESRLYSTGGLGIYASENIEMNNKNNLSHLQNQAPMGKSAYFNKINTVDLDIRQYRLLDKENIPYLATFIESSPRQSLIRDQVDEKIYEGTSYNYFHSVLVSTPQDSVLKRERSFVESFNQTQGIVDKVRKPYTYYQLLNGGEHLEQVFVAELFSSRGDTGKVGKELFPDNLRGLGRKVQYQPEPLTVDRNKLVMSDLLMGYQKEDLNKHEKGPTGFKVVHDRTIPRDKNLMIHFEVYHLQDQPGESNTFKVEYQIKPRDSNFFKRVFGGSDQVGLTLNFETLESYYKSDLEIVTSSFDAGEYELSLTLVEPATGRETSKKIRFHIGENAN